MVNWFDDIIGMSGFSTGATVKLDPAKPMPRLDGVAGGGWETFDVIFYLIIIVIIIINDNIIVVVIVVYSWEKMSEKDNEGLV